MSERRNFVTRIVFLAMLPGLGKTQPENPRTSTDNQHWPLHREIVE